MGLNDRNNGAPMEQTADAIRDANRILVCAHRNPDGDCLGSALALLLALESLDKNAVAYCPGPMLLQFEDIPNIHRIHAAIPTGVEFDLTLAADCADWSRIAENFRPRGRSVNIDHHASNTRFADINWVDPGAAATAEMVFALLGKLRVAITPDIAQAIYLGVMSDTGSFRFGNTTAVSLRIAAELVEKGADPAAAADLYWGNAPFPSARLRAETLAGVRLEAGGRLAWAQIDNTQYEKAGGRQYEPEGLSSDLRGIRGVRVAALFHELEDGGARVSLRSDGSVNVSRVAAEFGGGGHPAAAGITMKTPLAEAREAVLSALARALDGATP